MTANPADFLKLNHCLMALDWHAASALEIPDRHGEPEKMAKIKNEHSRKLPPTVRHVPWIGSRDHGA
jgi:hypothetical protein